MATSKIENRSEPKKPDIVGQLTERIVSQMTDRARLMIAVAGPPGAGKSTVCEALTAALNSISREGADNQILERLGLLPRKGAPETFDAAGLLTDLRRIRAAKEDVAVPIFDRAADLSRSSATIIAADCPVVLVEGNYLLLDRPVWRELFALFDLTVMLKVGFAELERRLTRRWLEFGHDPQTAKDRACGNDLANAKVVLDESIVADISFGNR